MPDVLPPIGYIQQKDIDAQNNGGDMSFLGRRARELAGRLYQCDVGRPIYKSTTGGYILGGAHPRCPDTRKESTPCES